MADVAVTAAQVAEVMPQLSHIVNVKLAATVTAGQVGYQLTAGTFGLADANDSGLEQARGIYLDGGVAGQVVRLLIYGPLYGFTVSSMNGDAVLYLSNTAGALADAAGTMTVVIGRVFVLTDGTKVAWIDARWAVVWA